MILLEKHHRDPTNAAESAEVMGRNTFPKRAGRKWSSRNREAPPQLSNIYLEHRRDSHLREGLDDYYFCRQHVYYLK